MHFFHELAIFWSAIFLIFKCFLSTLHPLSPVIFATATVVAFVLLPNSRFSFHRYTQHEATPSQKSARKWQLRPFATSCAKDYEGHSLVQTSFTEPPSRSSFGRMVQSVRGFGLAVRLVSRRPSARFRFGYPFSSKRLGFVDTVFVTLSLAVILTKH